MKIALLAAAHKSHPWRWARFLADVGHDVVLCSDTPPVEGMDYSGIRIRRPQWSLLQKIEVFKLRGGRWANNIHKWRAWKPIIEEEKPDVLHAHEALAYGPMLAHFPDYPKILTPWGPDMEALAGDDQEVARLVRQGLESADLISTNAPGLEEHWSRLSGLPAEKFRLFSWGVDSEEFSPAPAEKQREIRQRLGIPQEARVVLSPRLAQPIYQVDRIMEGWGMGKWEKARLVVLRAGAVRESWEELLALREKLADDSILMVDEYLNSQDLAALYSTASATVMIPKTDLLAMSLLEAMACGSLPIVAPLPCYLTALSDVEDPAGGSGKAIFLESSTTEAIAEGLSRWRALEDWKHRAANRDYVRQNHEWGDCAAMMIHLYCEAVGE